MQPGDTLSSIAGQVYGDTSQWRSVYDANREAIGDDPAHIRPGTQLTLEHD